MQVLEVPRYQHGGMFRGCTRGSLGCCVLWAADWSSGLRRQVCKSQVPRYQQASSQGVRVPLLVGRAARVFIKVPPPSVGGGGRRQQGTPPCGGAGRRRRPGTPSQWGAARVFIRVPLRHCSASESKVFGGRGVHGGWWGGRRQLTKAMACGDCVVLASSRGGWAFEVTPSGCRSDPPEGGWMYESLRGHQYAGA